MRARTKRGLGVLVLVAGGGGLACGEPFAPDEPAEAVAAAAQPVFGQGTVNAMNTTGPDAAVGIVEVKGVGKCSGTAINPRVVVTARHCFCKNPAVLPSEVTFILPGEPAIAAERIVAHGGALDVCTKTLTSRIAAGDVAVLVLAEPALLIDVDPSMFMKPYFLANAHDYLFKIQEGYRFFQTGFGDTSWNNAGEFGTRRTGPVLYFWEDEASDPFEGLYYAATANQKGESENSTFGHGDSGGPLWMARFDNGVLSEPRLVGVVSEFNVADKEQFWAPTWRFPFVDDDTNAAGMNGDLIRDALGPDADEDNDGVPDNVDNCPPVLCLSDPMDCYNPAQTDWDHDDYGNACDPCTLQGDFYVKDTPPPDWDHDGRPDACDLCPTLQQKGLGDSDKDHVGDECDNSPNSNPVNSCTSDADCPKTASGLHNFCILPKGICAAQADDEDGDGIADAYDLCPKNDQNGLHQIGGNSNVAAENRWTAPALGDVCDPVVTYVSRPQWQSGLTTCPTPSDPDAKCIDSLPFISTPGLGTETHTDLVPTTTSFKAPVGFRHCDCHDDGVELSYEDCIKGRCKVEDHDYFEKNSVYKRVTMATEKKPETSIYPSTNTPAYFASRTFTNDITYKYLGVPEGNLWRWKEDVEAGHVPGYPGSHYGEPIVTTTGIFWSHALPTTQATSPRDTGYGQQLRSNHEYVQTPLIDPVELPNKVPGWPNLKDCQLFPCWLLVRPGQAAINPNPFDRSIFERFSGSSLIVATPDAPLLIDQGAERYDATPLLSEALTTRLLEGETQWLRPAEAGHMFQDFQRGTAFVALPNEWTEGSTVSPIVMSDNRLVDAGRDTTHGFAASSEPESESESEPELVSEPSPRSGARGVFSARTGAVYLVGGTAGSGPSAHTTGEIWRYDLEERTWEDLPVAVPRVQNVLALGYDSARGQLLVLDAPKRTSWWRAPLRLLLVNTYTHTSKLLGQFPRTPWFDRYSLTARGDGSFLLVASRKFGAQVLMASLAVTDDEHLHWTGLSARSGKLADEPALTDDGVLVPLQRKGKIELFTITDRNLGPCKGVPGVF